METPNFINITKENFKTQVNRTICEKKKNKLARHKLALTHNVFHSRNCLIIGQRNVYKNQRNIEPLDFTLKPQVAENIASFLAPKFKKSDHFINKRHQLQIVQIQPQKKLAMFKSHALEQRLLILLKEQNSPKTPVRKLSTINNLYIRNQKKPLQKYYKKYNAIFLPRISARQE
jgi:hypothetical protein